MAKSRTWAKTAEEKWKLVKKLYRRYKIHDIILNISLLMISAIGIVGIICDNRAMLNVLFIGVVAIPYAAYARICLRNMLMDAEEDYIEFTKGAAWNPRKND